VTARDRQKKHRRWFLALDTFRPIGPWITPGYRK